MGSERVTTVIRTELLKLKRSLALALCALAPLSVAALSFLMLMKTERPVGWHEFNQKNLVMWAYFMLPMTVTALTALMGQMEHGPRTWNHLLALPVRRWQIFLAKATVVTGLAALMTATLPWLIYGSGMLGEHLRDGVQLTGAADVAATARALGMMLAGSLLLIVLQLWVALRFRSFVPPLALGIFGTFAAVAATSADEGVYFPWLIPVQVLSTDAARVGLALAVGVVGGLLALLIMLVDLERHVKV